MSQRGAGRVVGCRVVMDHQDAVGAEVHVELDAVGTQLDRPHERRDRVLGALAGGAAVSDDFDRASWD